MNDVGINNFLAPIGLRKYAKNFQSNGYDIESDFCYLGTLDLDLMGIKGERDRTRILEAGKKMFMFTHVAYIIMHVVVTYSAIYTVESTFRPTVYLSYAFVYGTANPEPNASYIHSCSTTAVSICVSSSFRRTSSHAFHGGHVEMNNAMVRINIAVYLDIKRTMICY